MILQRQPAPRRSRSRFGFSLVEMMVATTVLVIGVLGYLASVTAGDRLMQNNRETRRAYTAAQTVFAEMQACPIETVFQSYNASTSDDPTGARTSPGATFTADGLSSNRNGKTTVASGSVRFPSTDGVTLREDMVDAKLGMPRDLDGDGVISHTALTTSPMILPVEVQVEWNSSGGKRKISVRKFLFAGGTP